MKNALNIILLLTLLFSVIFSPVYSQSLGDLEDELDNKSGQVESKQKDLEKIKKEIEAINASSASVDEKIVLIEKEILKVEGYLNDTLKLLRNKSAQLKSQEQLLEKQKEQLGQVSYDLYKVTRVGILDYFFLNSSSAGFAQNLFYKQYLLSQHIANFRSKREEFAQINSEKLSLAEDKKALDGQREDTEKLKLDLIAQKNSYENQIYAKNSQSVSLKKQITLLKDEISDLQVAILVAKSGATTSVGTVPTSGDSAATLAGFQQSAPTGSFAVFSFGAYTHRLGMSQYGAQARAVVGNQDYKTILKAYYSKSPVTRGTSGDIKVQGYGSMDFETDYLYGIAEMPSSWDLEALKAQAVAARTYAYNYYYNGTTICITQSCQVWNPSKSANPPSRWKQAVDETNGKIISGVVTYYSATSGGYLTTSGWDTTDGQGGGNGWTTNAWESKANSPWFYRAWYRQTYSDSSAACSAQPNPWLSQAEMADLLNTYLVLKGSGVTGYVNTSRIIPVTLPQCKISGLSGNPYSMDEMKSLLSSPVTSINGNPVVTQNGAGATTKVSFVTNRGAVELSGADFKQVFNMRAPGYLSIPQNNYVFIDVLKK